MQVLTSVEHAPAPVTTPPVSLPTQHSSALPLLVALGGFVSALLTGFGTGLGAWRPMPLYLFFGVLLVWFQWCLTEQRSVPRILSLLVVAGFTLAFAGDVILHPIAGWHFTKSPWTYLMLNLLAFSIYAIDAARGLTQQQTPRRPLALLATHSAGLAILAFGAALAALVLQWGTTPYVNLDLSQTLGISLPDQIHNLQQVDVAVGLAMTALALLCFGLLSETSAASAPEGTPTTSVATTLRQAIAQMSDDVTFALRWALGPVLWLMSTFSLAYLAWLITDYLASVAHSRSTIDLFNPFAVNARARYWEGALSIELALIAAGTALMCIAVIERQARAITLAMQVLRRAAQTLILSFAFFTFSLAALNALAVFLGMTRLEPFQVSAMTLVALAASGSLALANRRRHSQPTT